MQTMLPSSLTGWGISSLDEDADGLTLLTAHLQSTYSSEERSSALAVTVGRGAAGFGSIHIRIRYTHSHCRALSVWDHTHAAARR